MKKSTTSSKSKFFLLSLALMPGLVHAALVGKVHALKGEAFMMHQGKTSVLTLGADIQEGADVLVTDEATLTLGDFFDRRHHLGAGSTLTMNDRAVILKKGSLWTQSVGAKSTGSVSTANMLIQGEQGEWVTTYDQASRRTQLTAISGEVRVASPQEPSFQYAVAAGFFTLADPKTDEGYPRSPTKIGYESLMKTLALFPGQKSRDAGLAKVQETQAAPQAERAIASVKEEAPVASQPARGEITFIRSSRKPASVEEVGLAQNYFVKKSVKAPKKMVRASGQNVALVRVFGATTSRQRIASTAPRSPASVPSATVATPAPQSQSVRGDQFLESFEQHSKQQPAKSPEVQRLIDDLTSY